MVWPDPVSMAAFQGVVLLVIAAFVAGVVVSSAPQRRLRNGALALVGVLCWLALTGGVTLSGIYAVSEPFPRLVPYVLASFSMTFILAFSPLGKQLATGVPVFWLVAFQAFRLPLELVLHAWGEQGTVPVDITLYGQNFDIAVGVMALVVAPVASRARWLVWVFEVVGLAMLANIVRIVALNTPGSPVYSPHGQPDLLLAAYVPTTWIVSICVLGAIAGHLVLLRWLWMTRGGRSEST